MRQGQMEMTERAIIEIAMDCRIGEFKPSFYKVFREEFGISPRRYIGWRGGGWLRQNFTTKRLQGAELQGKCVAFKKRAYNCDDRSRMKIRDWFKRKSMGLDQSDRSLIPRHLTYDSLESWGEGERLPEDWMTYADVGQARDLDYRCGSSTPS